jgi:hypothetical protein
MDPRGRGEKTQNLTLGWIMRTSDHIRVCSLITSGTAPDRKGARWNKAPEIPLFTSQGSRLRGPDLGSGADSGPAGI